MNRYKPRKPLMSYPPEERHRVASDAGKTLQEWKELQSFAGLTRRSSDRSPASNQDDLDLL